MTVNFADDILKLLSAPLSFLEEKLNGNYLIGLLLGTALFALFFFFRKKLSRLLSGLIGKLLFRKNEQQRDAVKKSLDRPLRAAWGFLGFFIFLRLLLGALLFTGGILIFLRIVVIVLVTWIILNYISEGLPLFIHFGSEGRFNATVMKFITNIIKVLTVIFSGVIIISELGYNISGLITGVGLGGLTFALAAQDSASNLFGGFVIIFDKPFQVGEWITTPSVDGIVEDITIRSTKIRTFADSLITIPNSVLANQAITNWSKMNKREVSFSIGLDYATPNTVLEKCKNEILAYLSENDDIEHETVRVFFKEFDDSALSFSVYYFSKQIEIKSYLKIKEDVNLNIKRIIENNGAKFAFPSRSVYIENDLKRDS